ncbi:glycogen/starch/alpha-glucan phosphorylase [Spongorhabdus nitratireducens]
MPLENSLQSTDLDAVQSLSARQVKDHIRYHLEQSVGIDADEAEIKDYWFAIGLFLRDINLGRVRKTRRQERESESRRVYYLSLEFLIGRLFGDHLHNLGVYNQTRKALEDMGLELEQVLEYEPDPALGNGGLGRLAACYMDSMTTVGVAAFGYGINYRFGLFKQSFAGGKQVESPDSWRENGFPWGRERYKRKQKIQLYGRVEEQDGQSRWVDTTEIMGIPWDIPVSGYGTDRVNTLRLWEGRAEGGFDLNSFEKGHYNDSRSNEIRAENLSQVLYPNDNHPEGQELRLIQQYFFVACSLADLMRRYRREYVEEGQTGVAAFSGLGDRVVIQLNDTHPALAVPEMMRILMDDEGISFADALDICRRVFCYTNHTLLPEALEKWPQNLIARVLPRHLQLIHLINHHFLHKEVEAKWPGDNMMKRRLSIIEEPPTSWEQPRVRMAFLATIGSSRVNGVAALHTELIKRDLFPAFDMLWPEKIVNVTNGVTPRRWLANCNPGLAELLDEAVQGDWRRDLALLTNLQSHATDSEFQQRYAAVKKQNKQRLAKVIEQECGVRVNTDAIFDVQIKRLHEYKRQHMNLLHIMALYRRLLENPELDVPPRVFIFGAKAAPGYQLAKTIIHAINCVSERINSDRRIKDKLKVVFIPNYRVSLAEKIIPAADVSEQISLAGLEASGTGNMKFAMNGALTVGTMDGANVEMAEEAGEENMFIFGMRVDEVQALRQRGYDPGSIYHQNPELKAVLDWMASGDLCPEEPEAFRPLVNTLKDSDYFMALADFQAYSDAHNRIVETWRQPQQWWKMAIINTATMGKFSSDRSIRDYGRAIWNIF